MNQAEFIESELFVHPTIIDKLHSRHGVTVTEVEECFYNNVHINLLEDIRENNKTTPPTQWFVAETNTGRLLKVCFIYSEENNTRYLKTAYEANANEIRIFERIFGDI